MDYVDLIIKGYVNSAGFFQMNVQTRGLVSEGGVIDGIPINPETITELRERYQGLIEAFHRRIRDRAEPAEPSVPKLAARADTIATQLPAVSIEAFRALRDACGEFIAAWDIALKNPPLAQEHYLQLWQLGNQMLDMLPGTARGILKASIQRTQSRQPKQGLRVILEVADNARRLFDLPWELLVVPADGESPAAMHDEGGFSARFLFLHHHAVFIRQVPSLLPFQPIAIDCSLPLQVIAAPLRRSPIDTEAFLAELRPLFSPGSVDGWWSAHPDTIETLHARLREHQPQIVQLLCHGRSPRPGETLQRHDILVTYVAGQQQVVYRISSHDLWPILSASAQLQLVVLTVCNSSGEQNLRANDVTVSNIAYDLVQAGVPMVIGMQGAIAQHAAARFCGVLYAALHEGHAVEWAVAAARAALGGNRWFIDWTIPVVYRQADLRERQAWHTRLADFLDARLIAPDYRRDLRAAVTALAVLLIIAGLGRAILWPSTLRPNVGSLRQAAFFWGIGGLICALTIDRLMIAWRTRLMEPAEAAALRHAHCGGALLGYAMGGWAAVLPVGGIFLTAGELINERAWQGLLLGMIGWSFLLGYVVARSQSRGARNNWRLYAAMYTTLRGWWPVYGGMAIMLFVVPLFLLTSYGQGIAAFVLRPGLSGAALGLAALAIVYAFDRERDLSPRLGPPPR